MKKLFFAICLLISFTVFAGDKVVKDTTIKGTICQIYEGSRGGKYIIVISKNGNSYKKYFKKQHLLTHTNN